MSVPSFYDRGEVPVRKAEAERSEAARSCLVEFPLTIWRGRIRKDVLRHFPAIEGRALDHLSQAPVGVNGQMDEGKFNALLEPPKKDRTVHVRVTADEHAAIEKAAADAGMTVSSFFRSLNLEGAGVRPILTSDDRLVMAALLEDMRMIGINLNQVARALNSGRGVHPSELDINLENVQRVQAAVMSELRALTRRAGYQRRGEK